MGLLLVALLMTACSGGGDDGENTSVTDQQPVLTFYVYAPERPMITRANEVNATAEENAIHNMQIWVFETGTNTKVGYLAPTSFPTTAEGRVYQMNVSKEFANAATKPNVDVYVVANGRSKTTLNGSTTRAELEDAVMGETDFGVSSPREGVPEGGLPMTGVLRDKAIGGENPVLRVVEDEDGGNMAKVRLLRMVSKVRYVFCKGVSDELPINGITIGADLIPTTEYLFLTENNNYRIGNDYVSSVTSLITTETEVPDVLECGNPTKYDINKIPHSLTAQEYEDLIDLGVKGDTENNIDPDLTLAGPFYFKESDKKLSGTITYTPPGETVSKDIPYSMKADDANSSFTRNHSWIVYAYYEGLSGMQIIVVDVTPWEETEENHSVYNW